MVELKLPGKNKIYNTHKGDVMVDFGEVMHRFYAGRQYGVRGPNYEDITWLESVPMPTREELAEKWETIKDEVALRKVAIQRSIPGNYPSKDELIVALWEMVVEGRPDFAQTLQARREDIKAQFPKPE
jgi:hypothetical protein